MSSHFTVVYDACVLYPAPLRDLLMWLAKADVFRARWTNQIHDEWINALLRERTDIKPEQLERTRALMNRNVRDCLVTDYEHLVSAVNLPDPNDRHVVAAAIKCGADLIVTFNLRDFPATTLQLNGIEAQHPDDFVFDLFDLHPAAVVNAVANQRASLRNPAIPIDQFLDTLLKQGLTRTVGKLRDFQACL